MDPQALFPVLAAGLVLAALWRRRRTGRWGGAPATWLLMALIFAAVAAWLRFGPPMTLVG
jgi:peptidoglycan/LPS O-acetylase OafA/YrhL